MSKEHSQVSVFVQLPGVPPYLFERINTLLQMPGLQRFRVAVAYARWDGLGLIAPGIEKLLKAGAELQTIYGIANGVTTPDSLLYSLYLQELYSTHTYAGTIEDTFLNSTFHLKFFEFTYSDKAIAVVGSANLTGGGLSRNTELDIEIQCKRGDKFENDLEAAWNSVRAASKATTLDLIRKLKVQSDLGSEHRDNETPSAKSGKPRLVTGAKASPKPLFAKVLDLALPTKKAKILANLDPITDRPDTLYLQILSGETGAPAAGGIGYQIQLPVATLATFFGVGPAQTKQASFRFGSEVITVHLTHFENNTHRVRLRPLRDVKRPAIVVFRRTATDEYACSIVPQRDYAKVLATRCTEQTRAGARRWGME